MKVAFILQEDVLNQNTWSGTPYFIYTSIKEIIPDIQLLAPLNITSFNKIKRKLLKIINRLLFIISKKIILNHDTPDFILKEWSKQVDEYINQNNIELIISTSIFPFVYTKSNFKMVQITDATPILLIKDYQNMLFSDRLIRKKENHSLQVVKKSDLIVSASDWCRDSAVNYYNIDEKKVITIPFGANFDDSEIVYNEKSIDKNKQVNFLFVGKDWQRKGLDIAISILDIMYNQGYKIKFTIVGVKIPDYLMRSYISNIEFLDKNKTDDRKELIWLFNNSHFYFMPSRAEAYGIVFAEAAGFGLPVISSNMGGIPTIVLNNETGILLELTENVEKMSEKIIKIIEQPDLYISMSRNARKRYESLLNWTSFSKRLISEIKIRHII